MNFEPNIDHRHRPHSFSSALMMGVTLYRNDTIVGRFSAEIVYLCTVKIALIETAVAAVFTCFTIPLAIVTTKPFSRSVTWLSSSLFTVIWSLAYVILNLGPFVYKLVADERSARSNFLNFKLLNIPDRALI